MKSEFDTLYESLISELYSHENMYLRGYLKDRPVEFDDIVLRALPDFLFNGENDDIVAKMSELAGQEIDSGTDLLELDYEYFYNLPQEMQDRIGEYVDEHSSEIYHNMDAEKPSIYHFDKGEMIPRQTWLIHFTNDAYKIKSEGFKYGTEDMRFLGLTTWSTQSAKKYGGYNFAFEAGSKEAAIAEYNTKYGKEAVMFQNSGTKAYHWGDEEHQVIFWGADVNPKDLVVLRKDSDDNHWIVERQDGKGKGWAYKSEHFEDVVAWVMKNYAQYRKVIT